MKKKFLFIGLFVVCMFSFNTCVSALCSDSELTDWAVGVNIKFIDFDKYLVDDATGKEIHELGFDYAYILALNSSRDDIIIKATTKSGRQLEGMYVPGHKVYGLVDYNPKNGVNYKITIYGGENSACPNEVLKTLNYEVEQFNFYHKTEQCENYPEAEVCKMYKDTSKMTQSQFEKEIEKYIEEVNGKKEDGFFTKVMKFMVSYGIFVLLPLIIIMIGYMIKVGKLKKNGRKK